MNRSSIISTLLEHALAEAQKLPEIEQDAVAAMILEEIEDERLWDDKLSRSPEKLAMLAACAEDQVRAGHARVAGFDEL